MGFFTPTPNHTDAYYNDGVSEYFGKALKGCSESTAGWQIFKMDACSAGTTSAWTIKYPVDSETGVASAAPKFVWGVSGSNVKSYTYNVLGL